MKSQTLAGKDSLVFLASDMVTLGVESVQDTAQLQAVVSRMYAEAVEDAAVIGDIVQPSPPSVSLIGRQDQSVVWYIGIVILVRAHKHEENQEVDKSKVIPGGLQEAADVAAAYGGRVNYRSQQQINPAVLAAIRRGKGGAIGAAGEFVGVPDQHIAAVSNIFNAAGCAIGADGAADIGIRSEQLDIEAIKKATTRVIKAVPTAESGEQAVQPDSSARLWLPKPGDL